MTDKSAAENALLYQIVQVILSSATNLTSLDMSQIDAPLTTAVINAVNSHSFLQRIILEDVQQLYLFPHAFLSSPSLSRLRFHTGGFPNETDPPHALPVLQTILTRDPEGPHIYELTLTKPFLSGMDESYNQRLGKVTRCMVRQGPRTVLRCILRSPHSAR